MKQFIKKNNKLATRNGRLIRTDRPEDCPCCVQCDCLPPPTITGLKLKVRPGKPEEFLCVIMTYNWAPPDDCYVDAVDSRTKVTVRAEFLNDSGVVVYSVGEDAEPGDGEIGYCIPISTACGIVAAAQQIKLGRIRVEDKSGDCPPSPWDQKPLDAGTDGYGEICPGNCDDSVPSQVLFSVKGSCFNADYDIPMVELYEGYFEGLGTGGLYFSEARATANGCANGIWPVSIFVSSFADADPDLPPCSYEPFVRLKCGRSTTVIADDGTSLAITLNCQPRPPGNPLP